MDSYQGSYIVRIYRFEKGNPRGLVGIVEEIGIGGDKRAFKNLDDLWEILNHSNKSKKDNEK